MAENSRPPAGADDFLIVAEIAATLKLNQQTVRNWIDAGTLPAYRVGRRVRIARRDFDVLVGGSSTAPAAADEPWDLWGDTPRDKHFE